MHRQVDVERARLLLQEATRSENKAATSFNRVQVDAGKEKSQYFEKLAIGSGAAIAAIVSFLGAHSGSGAALKPGWILRCSLVSLVVALFAALYRNFRYPYYVFAVWKRLWVEATRYQQQCNDRWLHLTSVANNPVVDFESGKAVEMAQ
jgi:hypothetical protein